MKSILHLSSKECGENLKARLWDSVGCASRETARWRFPSCHHKEQLQDGRRAETCPQPKCCTHGGEASWSLRVLAKTQPKHQYYKESCNGWWQGRKNQKPSNFLTACEVSIRSHLATPEKCRQCTGRAGTQIQKLLLSITIFQWFQCGPRAVPKGKRKVIQKNKATGSRHAHILNIVSLYRKDPEIDHAKVKKKSLLKK